MRKVVRSNRLRLSTGLCLTLVVSCAGRAASGAPTVGRAGPLKLHDGWALQSSAKVREGGEVLSSTAFRPQGWYRATVPSTVVGAQVAAGVFGDPYFGMNLRKIPGMTYPIGLNSFNNVPMDRDSPYARSWWYRTEFRLPREYRGRRVWLHFAGINYRAHVWLNGRKVADAKDVAGAYRLYEFDVTPWVVPGGRNALAIETFAPTEKDLAINWVDWNPTPPDKNMGLWGDVSLASSGPVAVRHPQVVTHLPDGSLERADLTVMAQVHNASRLVVQGVLEAQVDEIRLRQAVRLLPGETRSVAFEPKRFPALRVRRPRLWWPTEMGTPNLHDLTVRYRTGTTLSDEQRARFGIREVTSELDEQGHRVFRVNGKRILIRGAEWARDMLQRPPSRERLEAELQYVLDMRLNTLRLEGQLESDSFFDLTDEKGILVIAGWCCCDVWERWAEWPSGNLAVARESLRTEALKMRRHPSLLAWLNGSDGPPPPEVERAYLGVLEEVAWPNPVVSSAADVTTPVSGRSGVKMTGPYDYEPPSYWLAATVKEKDEAAPLDNARYGGAFGFNTETGPGPAIPPLESLRRWLPLEHLWPIDEFWYYHAAGERFQNLNRFNEAMDATYGPPSSLDDYLRKAQAMAYDGVRAMFEAYGRNKYTSTGVIHWTLNNAWPSIYWHLYGYDLYPAGGYFGTKKANEPLHVQYSYDDRSVVVVNSRRAPVAGLAVSAHVYDFELKELFACEVKVEVEADGSKRALTLPPFPTEPATVYFVKLLLRDSARNVMSRNFYWLPAKPSTLDWDKTTDTAFAPIATFEDLRALNRLPQVRLRATVTVGRTRDSVRVAIHNPTRSLAFQVHLGVRKRGAAEELLPAYWEDNYVALMPGESREIAVRYLQRGVLGDDAEVVVDGWNVEPLTVRPRSGAETR